MLHTVDEVIDAMGGNVKASELLDIVPHAVSMMRSRGIPNAHHLKIFLYLTSRGYKINTDDVFGYSLQSIEAPKKRRSDRVVSGGA